MIKKPITIQLSEGLDARPIALLVQEASQYSSTVYIEVADKQVNAKSIMGMMSLRLTPGEEITVVANGADEEEAAKGIETFLVNVKNK
ncbi:HPr family phosphocarrier protein [bacterium]|uniref:HPr family phosphocarrier protein n=1 Tax=Lachnospiraceae TaxID=186803 RepID=UPI002A257364|nr:HPr family phosphocarrier protein [bacterium]MDY2886136.1 HPr family phosphocarrier protein [Bariatricus sp.]MCI7148684.1 HPr family phosphocarrier protein [bacterium]MDD6514122.1 HPr family phosphocarrier protein [bacterium]MDD7142479.1 HPr family phosphocarrier protein [bacterium]